MELHSRGLSLSFWVCKTQTKVSATDFCSQLFLAEPKESKLLLPEWSSCPLSRVAFAVSRFSRGSQGFPSFFLSVFEVKKYATVFNKSLGMAYDKTRKCNSD